MAKISMQITVETEFRGDHWACYVPEFGAIVYGETSETARREVNVALQVLLDSFHRDLEAIERFLVGRNVKYNIQHDTDIEHGNPASEMGQEEVLIAV